MKNTWIAAVLLAGASLTWSCGNQSTGTGTTDTNFNIGTDPSSGRVDTGINGTNGSVPHVPDSNNNRVPGSSPQQNDTLRSGGH